MRIRKRGYKASIQQLDIMYRLIVVTAISIVLSYCPSALADDKNNTSTEVKVPYFVPGTDEIYDYVHTLLRMSLTITEEEYGKAVVVPDDEPTVQMRQLLNLEQGLLDVTWSVTTDEREQNHRAIRIPLAAGMFGVRLLMVRAQDTRFDQTLSLQELKMLVAVQGLDWPDTEILYHNGFDVIAGTYQSSFRLLAESFVDFFPRGMLEIGYEVEYFNAQGDYPVRFEVEPNILILYPNAMYFFVAKENKALAERLEKGLHKLVENGQMAALLRTQNFYQKSIRLVKNRQVHLLINPLLTERSAASLKTYLPKLSSTINQLYLGETYEGVAQPKNSTSPTCTLNCLQVVQAPIEKQ